MTKLMDAILQNLRDEKQMENSDLQYNIALWARKLNTFKVSITILFDANVTVNEKVTF